MNPDDEARRKKIRKTLGFSKTQRKHAITITTAQENSMTTQTIHANVTDTNHRPRGTMTIEVEFDAGAPFRVEHNGQTYYFTHKAGTNFKTGLPVREMATEDDARLWITLDGQQVWED